jgi:beta-glucosidase
MLLRLVITAVFVTAASSAYVQPKIPTEGRGDSLENAPYKNPNLPVEARLQDLVSRMTIEEKTAQLMQGDISNWLNTTSGTFNHSSLVQNFE